MANGTDDEFERLLRTYLNVDACLVDDLTQYLQTSARPELATHFRRKLADAILYDAISPEEYERLTYEDFDSQDALRDWFVELWHNLYGDVPYNDCGGSPTQTG